MTSLVEEVLRGIILCILKLTNVNMENHMILVKERTAICSQLMSTQETVFPCDDMQRSNTKSRGFPLDKKTVRREKASNK